MEGVEAARTGSLALAQQVRMQQGTIMQEPVMEAVLVDVNGLAGMAEGLRASLEATEGARGQVANRR